MRTDDDTGAPWRALLGSTGIGIFALLLTLVPDEPPPASPPNQTGGPASQAKPAPAEPSADSPMSIYLASCGVDQVREFSCGDPSGLAPGEPTHEGPAGRCPKRASAIAGRNGYYLPGQRQHPDLPFDPMLTTLHRLSHAPGAWNSSDCCYSACRPLDVRKKGHVANDYRYVECIPATESTAPAPNRPECPNAVYFTGDLLEHIAVLLPEHTQRPRDVRVTQKQPHVPLAFPTLRWCCYHSVPMAAIGPL